MAPSAIWAAGGTSRGHPHPWKWMFSVWTPTSSHGVIRRQSHWDAPDCSVSVPCHVITAKMIRMTKNTSNKNEISFRYTTEGCQLHGGKKIPCLFNYILMRCLPSDIIYGTSLHQKSSAAYCYALNLY